MLSHPEPRTGFALNKSVVTHCSEAGVAVEVGLMQGFSGYLHVESHGLQAVALACKESIFFWRKRMYIQL